jgi:Rieske Fe-S protein
MSSGTDTQEDRASGSDKKRRSFLVEIAAIVVGGLASLGPLAVGLYAVLSEPFRARKTPANFSRGDGSDGTSSDEYFVTMMESLSDDGLPRRFEVIANKFDAWNFVPDQPIGAIYLSKQDAANESDQGFVDEAGKKWSVVAFHTTCPHAGCSVSFEQTVSAFLCPCHNSSFNSDGTKRDLEGSHNPSPRPLDRLKVNDEKLAGGEVWVEFFDFYTGREDRIRKA